MPTASGSYGDSSSCTRTPRATAKRAEAFIHWRAREEGSRETRTACWALRLRRFHQTLALL